MEEAFSEWILHSAHFNISFLPLIEAWQWSVAASDCRRLRSQVENSVHNTQVGVARESDSSSQLVGGAPQQARRASRVGEMMEARLTTHTGAAQLCRRPLKSQCTTVDGGGLPPSSPDRGHQILMDTPLRVRLWVTGVGAGATEGVGRGNG